MRLNPSACGLLRGFAVEVHVGNHLDLVCVAIMHLFEEPVRARRERAQLARNRLVQFIGRIIAARAARRVRRQLHFGQLILLVNRVRRPKVKQHRSMIRIGCVDRCEQRSF